MKVLRQFAACFTASGASSFTALSPYFAMPSAGRRKCQTCPSGRGALPIVFGGRSVHFASPLTPFRRYEGQAARLAPISELPQTSCIPNQGTGASLWIAPSHSETSASSTATGLRSTPNSPLAAMYVPALCFSIA